ncbi:signal recognition particle protein [Candidatus Micrarchaeota archaeon]|nr:signal recognition particle protein [Candidatus Micrarchaeota archaeon]
MDLGRGLRNILARISGAPIVDARVVKQVVKELQRVLISADVNVKLVFELTKQIEKNALDERLLKGLTMREHVLKVVYDELVKFLGESYKPELRKQKILLCGLYGSGKTTTAAKLAYYYKSKGLTTALVACDVDRPAAYEQLEQLSKQVPCAFYGIKGETDVRTIVRYALKNAKEDVILLDSAGRSAFDDKLVEELRIINDEFKPDKKFLVVSADIGQVAGKQAEQFNTAIGINGVIVTKIDGSAKGGGALSAVAHSGAHIAFLGHGEKIGDIEVYDSKKFVGRLLGIPDFESLLEKAKKIAEEEQIKPESIEELNFETFYQQLKAAKKMGPLKKVMGMFGAPDVPKELMDQSELKLKRYEAMINSMTPDEKKDVNLIKHSRTRIERIAKGSGVPPENVKSMIREFEKMRKMLNMMKRNRSMRGNIQKMLKSGKFKIPPM